MFPPLSSEVLSNREEDIKKMCAVWSLRLTALTSPEIKAIIAAGGFDTAALFLQTLFIHAWFAKRKSANSKSPTAAEQGAAAEQC